MVAKQKNHDSERIAWMRLAHTDGVGAITFFKLLEQYGSPEAALSSLPTLRGKKKLAPPPPSAIEKDLSRIEKIGATLLLACDPAYPDALRAIPDPPPYLILLGNTSLLSETNIAIVGARNASTNGRTFARRLALDLAKNDRSVISGMARGIDTAAHEGALTHPEGNTIAVLAGGVDNIYPKENAKLYAAIKERGLLISEHPIGTMPQARHFPRRNRIVSGIAQGTVIVEATQKSGSLITARMAMEQGRDVFAVPGSPLDPRSSGPNSLIRDGAILVEGAEDIINHQSVPFRIKRSKAPETTAELPLTLPDRPEKTYEKPTTLLDSLSTVPVHVDILIRESGLNPADVFASLLEMELAGRIERHPGNRVALIPEQA